ncbi:MAG: glycogen debranching protein [Gemmatimonadota bacterium]|nr:glycogen debranching protein [Gemmatimonadota bacterium]
MGAAAWLRVAAFLVTPISAAAQAGGARAGRFIVTDSSVRQGRFEATAVSRDTILSSYPRAAREVRFRFSINGAENEFPGGTEHTIYLRPRTGRLVTRMYHFGDETEPPPPTAEESAGDEDGIARVTFRVDLRQVLRSLRTKGFYYPPLGARIGRGELAHVYVLGDPEPLTWEYAALRPGSPLELSDSDGDGIYEGTVPIATAYTRPRAADGRALWARTLDLSAFPELASSQRMQDALYRLSLEELRQLVREDGALSAGAKWPGVWTRDVALSTILSLAIVAPDVTRKSLLAKVDSTGRIIQDTGTGGSWPVSSDRMVWSLAAWEIYAVTGDSAWLRRAYDITRRSAEADLHAVRDDATGLFRGESSFMDWREQSYPRWMQPADIYRSQNLGTNAVHYAAYRVLSRMSRALGEPAARWDSIADRVQAGMTAHLWQRDRGWYGQYRYGRAYLSLSPRAEGLGEALASIFGAASPEQRAALVRKAPVVAFGTPTFWPYTRGERFYHNATIWPFVTAFWTWAAAEGGNTLAVQRGLDDATRAAALFLTNKENMVAATGHYEGTALNSDRQLWSVAGTLAGTFRLLFGMRLETDRLAFRPMVPPSYAGERTVRRLRYRHASLTITVRGFGDSVRSAILDGKPARRAEVMAATTGAHTLEITMNGRWRGTTVHEVSSRFAPATPRAELRGDALVWNRTTGAARYVVYRNGAALARTMGTRIAVRPGDALDEYQVLAISDAGDESFLSEPVRVVAGDAVITAKPGTTDLERDQPGFSGAGYARLAIDRNVSVRFEVRVVREGTYSIDVRYANGNGPVNTEDKVAVRTLLIDRDTAGVIVMPQRGVDRWSEWGWSSALIAPLRAGPHTLTLTYSPSDANMNRQVNTALVDHLRLTRLADADRGSR